MARHEECATCGGCANCDTCECAQARIAELESANMNYQARIGELSAKYEAQQQRLAQAVIDISAANTQVAKLESRLKRLGWGVVANVAFGSTEFKTRWSYVCRATGLGSTSAQELCKEHGFDPDEMLPLSECSCEEIGDE